MHEQGYTQNDMNNLTEQSWKGRITYLLVRKCIATKKYSVVAPNQGGGSKTMKTNEHLEY